MTRTAFTAGLTLVAFLICNPASPEDFTAGAAVVQYSQSQPVEQYTEDIPTAGGSKGKKNDGDGGGGAAAPALPPSVTGQLENEGGTDKKALKKLATSPDFGAPRTSGLDGGDLEQVEPDPSVHSTAAAAVGSAFTDDSGSRLGWLVGAMLFIGTAGIVIAIRRARVRSRP